MGLRELYYRLTGKPKTESETIVAESAQPQGGNCCGCSCSAPAAETAVVS